MTVGPEHIVELNGALTIRDAAAIKTSLETALAAHPSVLVDCTGLTGADIAIVQLLASAHKTAAATGRALRLRLPAAGALPALLQQAGIVDAAGRPKPPHGAFWIGQTPSEAA